MMTTDSSSSPFAQDELVAILDLVDLLIPHPFLTLLTFSEDEKIADPYSIWVIGMTMPRYVMKWC